MKLTDIKPKYVDVMPEQLDEGVLYISDRYGIAIHLCACGCKGAAVTPLGNGGWTVTKKGEAVTLRPSIGNWSGENPYHAHYYITENKIQWLG